MGERNEAKEAKNKKIVVVRGFVRSGTRKAGTHWLQSKSKERAHEEHGVKRQHRLADGHHATLAARTGRRRNAESRNRRSLPARVLDLVPVPARVPGGLAGPAPLLASSPLPLLQKYSVRRQEQLCKRAKKRWESTESALVWAQLLALFLNESGRRTTVCNSFTGAVPGQAQKSRRASQRVTSSRRWQHKSQSTE